MRLDDAMPTWDYREHHQISLAAPPEDVRRAIDDLTWREVPLFGALTTARFLGRDGRSGDSRILAWFVDQGFMELDRTADELVFGAIQRFDGKLRSTAETLPVSDGLLDAFRAVDGPGRVKLSINFGFNGSSLRTETRVHATDSRSRTSFAPYWLFIRPWSGLIRRVWLRAIGRRAGGVH